MRPVPSLIARGARSSHSTENGGRVQLPPVSVALAALRRSYALVRTETVAQADHKDPHASEASAQTD
jgi:hypothetical protein